VDLTVSRPVKILALVLVIAGVGGIASLSMLGKSSGAASSNAQLSVAQIRARAHHTATTATTAPAHASHAAPAKQTRTTAKPAKHASAAPTAPTTTPAAPAAPPKPKPTVTGNGLPIVLADALHQHRIVVVSIFDPQSQTDAVSYAEARAGAGDAQAGFLGVSVLDDTVAGPLTAALPGGGLLPLPGVLIYRAPGMLVEKISGFADRDAVAALALQAKTAPAMTATPAAGAITTPVTPAAPVAPPAAAPTTTTP
jgi:hypothetical protein